MHKFFSYNKFIIFLYIFRALLCSSSGDQNCIIQHLVSSQLQVVARCTGWERTRQYCSVTFISTLLSNTFRLCSSLCMRRQVLHPCWTAGNTIVEGSIRIPTSQKKRVDSSWNVMAHGDAREGKWRGNWRMEFVACTLHTASEHGVSSINTADAHTSAASSRLNWRPPPADLNAVGSQYPSHYLGTWCIQHYYRWCAHLGCQ